MDRYLCKTEFGHDMTKGPILPAIKSKNSKLLSIFAHVKIDLEKFEIMKRLLLFLVLISGLTLSCEEQLTQSERDLNTIREYIEDNNLNALEHSSGLYYFFTQDGTGSEMPSPIATVEVKYKGYFTDGEIFDQSPGENTVELSLPNTILAWRIGIPLMTKGSKATFIVPSGLGYGFFGSGPVPPNTVILFDVELVNFSG